jgi:MerR family copper efflux transcriptional regulator
VIRRMKPLEFSLDEMKRLLDSLDLLSGTDGDEQQRRDAATFVIDCHHRAEESIARLRKRLAYASELTEVLAREARRVAVEPTSEIEPPPSS